MAVDTGKLILAHDGEMVVDADTVNALETARSPEEKGVIVDRAMARYKTQPEEYASNEELNAAVQAEGMPSTPLAEHGMTEINQEGIQPQPQPQPQNQPSYSPIRAGENYGFSEKELDNLHSGTNNDILNQTPSKSIAQKVWDITSNTWKEFGAEHQRHMQGTTQNMDKLIEQGVGAATDYWNQPNKLRSGLVGASEGIDTFIEGVKDVNYNMPYSYIDRAMEENITDPAIQLAKDIYGGAKRMYNEPYGTPSLENYETGGIVKAKQGFGPGPGDEMDPLQQISYARQDATGVAGLPQYAGEYQEPGVHALEGDPVGSALMSSIYAGGAGALAKGAYGVGKELYRAIPSSKSKYTITAKDSKGVGEMSLKEYMAYTEKTQKPFWPYTEKYAGTARLTQYFRKRGNELIKNKELRKEDLDEYIKMEVWKEKYGGSGEHNIVLDKIHKGQKYIKGRQIGPDRWGIGRVTTREEQFRRERLLDELRREYNRRNWKDHFIFPSKETGGYVEKYKKGGIIKAQEGHVGGPGSKQSILSGLGMPDPTKYGETKQTTYPAAEYEGHLGDDPSDWSKYGIETDIKTENWDDATQTYKDLIRNLDVAKKALARLEIEARKEDKEKNIEYQKAKTIYLTEKDSQGRVLPKNRLKLKAIEDKIAANLKDIKGKINNYEKWALGLNNELSQASTYIPIIEQWRDGLLEQYKGTTDPKQLDQLQNKLDKANELLGESRNSLKYKAKYIDKISKGVEKVKSIYNIDQQGVGEGLKKRRKEITDFIKNGSGGELDFTNMVTSANSIEKLGGKISLSPEQKFEKESGGQEGEWKGIPYRRDYQTNKEIDDAAQNLINAQKNARTGRTGRTGSYPTSAVTSAQQSLNNMLDKIEEEKVSEQQKTLDQKFSDAMATDLATNRSDIMDAPYDKMTKEDIMGKPLSPKDQAMNYLTKHAVDWVELGLSVSGAMKKTPKWAIPPEYLEYIEELKQLKDQPLTADELTQLKSAQDESFHDVLQQLSKKGLSPSQYLGSLPLLLEQRQKGLLNVQTYVDKLKRDATKTYGAELGQMNNFDRMIFSDEYKESMMDKQMAYKAAGDIRQRMADDQIFEQMYGPNSLHQGYMSMLLENTIQSHNDNEQGMANTAANAKANLLQFDRSRKIQQSVIAKRKDGLLDDNDYKNITDYLKSGNYEEAEMLLGF